MARFQHFAGPLVATLVGVVSGVYIFNPLIQSSMQSMQDTQKTKKTLEASVPPADPASLR